MHRLLKNLQNQQARTTACRTPHTPSVALPATFGSENDSAGIAARSRRVKAQDRARRPSSNGRLPAPATASTMVGKVNIGQLKGLVLRKPV